MSKNKTAIIAGFLTIILALFNNSCTSGNNGKKETDVKQLLNQAIQSIEKLEKENRDLRVDVEHTQKDKITQENKSLKEELKKTKKDNEELQAQVRNLEGQVAHTNLQLESKEDKSVNIAKLEKDNKVLQEEISKLKGLLSYTRLQLESKDDQSGRIAELENKNKELSILFEKINEIAKGQKEEVSSKSAP